MRDADAAEAWIDQTSAHVEAQAAQAGALAAQVGELTSTASTADGAVEVTVGSTGVLTGVRFDDRVLKWTPEEIADEVMAAVRKALDGLADQVGDLVEQTVGSDSATGRAVVEAFASRVPPSPAADSWAHRRDTGGWR